jgi:hypothetical protein
MMTPEELKTTCQVKTVKTQKKYIVTTIGSKINRLLISMEFMLVAATNQLIIIGQHWSSNLLIL